MEDLKLLSNGKTLLLINPCCHVVLMLISHRNDGKYSLHPCSLLHRKCPIKVNHWHGSSLFTQCLYYIVVTQVLREPARVQCSLSVSMALYHPITFCTYSISIIFTSITSLSLSLLEYTLFATNTRHPLFDHVSFVIPSCEIIRFRAHTTPPFIIPWFVSWMFSCITKG